MRRIIIAAILLGVAAHFATSEAEEKPDWREVGQLDGITYIADYNSIVRVSKKDFNKPSQARITIYRHEDGAKIDKEAFLTMRFDCKGRFGFWDDDPKSMERIKADSMASSLEDLACWGSTEK